jgi:hypothetical protein
MILNALLFSSTIPFASKKRKRQIIFDIAYSLVWEAKRVWGENDGHIKRAYVKAKLYIIISTMPILQRCVMEEQYIEDVIQEAYDKMTKYLASKGEK